MHDAGGVVDVHLMIERPERQVDAFAKAGADGITLHAEATPHVNYALAAVREAGCRAGLALNPATPADAVAERDRRRGPRALHDGQPRLGRAGVPAGSPAKLERLRALLGPDTVLEVDGGIAAGDRRPRAPRPGRRCSSPARRCSARPTRARPCARSPRRGVRPGHTRGTCRTVGTASRTVGGCGRDHTGAVGPRVLIVDDHPSFRASARVLLEAEGFDVVGEAADGARRSTEAGRLRPEVVLLDVQLPDIDGFDVAARLTGADDAPTVILVSSRDGSDFGPLVTRSGARGFVPKAELSGDRVQELLP